MEYRRLGGSGLKVSAVGLGCNNFGMRCDAEQTRVVVHEALDAGIEIIPASQDLLDATNEFRFSDIPNAIAIAESQAGITGAADKIARFQALVEKWTALTDAANGDVDAIAAAVQTEVWDKVDWSTYGL